jgi:HK97 family phage prohead protease
MQQLSDRASLAREDRAFTVEGAELRAEDDGTVTFEGIASSVDSPYSVRDAFGEFEETIARGAFKKTLAEKDDVALLVNHDGVPLARTKSKTLRLSAVPDLAAAAKLDMANPTVQEIRSAMSRGDLDQMSIGFRVVRQEWNGDYTERTIREVKLFDVSIVTFPANPNTSATLRALDDAVKSFTAAADFDEATLRRAIVHLESLLPPAEEVEERADVTEYLNGLRNELWSRRIPA